MVKPFSPDELLSFVDPADISHSGRHSDRLAWRKKLANGAAQFGYVNRLRQKLRPGVQSTVLQHHRPQSRQESRWSGGNRWSSPFPQSSRMGPSVARSDLKQAAKQVAVDANQVREDLKTLLLSRENLSVEALREVAERALALIAEKTGVEKRSLIGGVIVGALSIGESITGLFSRSAGDAPNGQGRRGV